jgi:lipopolysaccharide biosynthesis protein
MGKNKNTKRKVIKITTPTSEVKKKIIGSVTKMSNVRPRGEDVFDGLPRILHPHFHNIPPRPVLWFDEEQYKKLIVNRKLVKPRVVLILHLFYLDLGREYLKKLIELKKILKFHLYVSVVRNSRADNDKLKISYEKELGANVRVVRNAGKDILPKLTIMKELVDQKKNYDYVFLLHDKKSPDYERSPEALWMDSWRSDLVSLLFDKEIREKCFLILQDYKNIGILGHEKHLQYGPGWHPELCPRYRYLNESKLLDYQEVLTKLLKINIVRDLPQKTTWFIGGTMFWMRWGLVEDFFKSCALPMVLASLGKEINDVKDPSLTHAFERFFGHMAVLKKQRVVGYGKPNS